MKSFIISFFFLFSAECSNFNPCKNGGVCKVPSGLCECPPTYFGESCELSEYDIYKIYKLNSLYSINHQVDCNLSVSKFECISPEFPCFVVMLKLVILLSDMVNWISVIIFVGLI